MAIERFLEVLGTPNQPKPVSVETAKPNSTEPKSKPGAQEKKMDEKLEKSIKETSDRIFQIEDGIKGLQGSINQSCSDKEATLARLSGIETELKSIQQILSAYRKQVGEYIALAEIQQRCCPNCNADVDWPNLPFEEGSATWFDGCLRRTCPDCGHQIKKKKV
ncbi:hypothetical protein ACFLXN_02265 [Chloroflexota bacterium]